MTNSMRIRIAAVVTALFIAALSVGGLAVRGMSHQAQAPAAAAAVVAQPDQRSAPVTSRNTVPGGDDGWEIEDD